MSLLIDQEEMMVDNHVPTERFVSVETTGEELLNLRKQLKLSLAQMADIIRVTPRTISRYQAMERPLTDRQAESLAKYLEATQPLYLSKRPNRQIPLPGDGVIPGLRDMGYLLQLIPYAKTLYVLESYQATFSRALYLAHESVVAYLREGLEIHYLFPKTQPHLEFAMNQLRFSCEEACGKQIHVHAVGEQDAQALQLTFLYTWVFAQYKQPAVERFKRHADGFACLPSTAYSRREKEFLNRYAEVEDPIYEKLACVELTFLDAYRYLTPVEQFVARQKMNRSCE